MNIHFRIYQKNGAQLCIQWCIDPYKRYGQFNPENLALKFTSKNVLTHIKLFCTNTNEYTFTLGEANCT